MEGKTSQLGGSTGETNQQKASTLNRKRNAGVGATYRVPLKKSKKDRRKAAVKHRSGEVPKQLGSQRKKKLGLAVNQDRLNIHVPVKELQLTCMQIQKKLLHHKLHIGPNLQAAKQLKLAVNRLAAKQLKLSVNRLAAKQRRLLACQLEATQKKIAEIEKNLVSMQQAVLQQRLSVDRLTGSCSAEDDANALIQSENVAECQVSPSGNFFKAISQSEEDIYNLLHSDVFKAHSQSKENMYDFEQCGNDSDITNCEDVVNVDEAILVEQSTEETNATRRERKLKKQADQKPKRKRTLLFTEVENNKYGKIKLKANIILTTYGRKGKIVGQSKKQDESDAEQKDEDTQKLVSQVTCGRDHRLSSTPTVVRPRRTCKKQCLCCRPPKTASKKSAQTRKKKYREPSREQSDTDQAPRKNTPDHLPLENKIVAVDAIRKAVQSVLAEGGNKSVRKVAAEFNLTYKTLLSHCLHQQSYHKLLSVEDRKTLETYLIYLIKHDFSVSEKLIQKAIVTLMTNRDQKLLLHNPGNLSKTVKGPALTWCSQFKILHPEIFQQDTAVEGQSRKLGKYLPNRIINLIHSRLIAMNLSSCPEQIFSCREMRLTGLKLYTKERATRYICKRTKTANIYTAEKSENELLTLFLGISASGRILPPFFVSPKLPQHGLPNSNISVTNGIFLETSENWNMAEELFSKWFEKVFVPNCNSSTYRPVALLMNDVNLLSPEVIESAESNNIVIQNCPPSVRDEVSPMEHEVIDLISHNIETEISYRKDLGDTTGIHVAQEEQLDIVSRAISMVNGEEGHSEQSSSLVDVSSSSYNIPTTSFQSIIHISVENNWTLESHLSDFVQYLSDHGFSVTTKVITLALASLVESSGVREQLDTDVSEWCRRLMDRYPHLSHLVTNKKSSDENENIQHFDILKSILSKLNLCESPAQVFSFGRADVKIKKKQAGAVTVYMAMSGSGQVLPPFIHLSCERKQKIQSFEIPVEWVFTDNRKRNDFIFHQWFEASFVPSCVTENNYPVLLLMDNSSCFLSPEVIECAKEKNIHLVQCPCDAVHRLQPIEISIFKEFLEILEHGSSSDNVTGSDNPLDYIFQTLQGVVSKISTVDIKNAFCKAGVFPSSSKLSDVSDVDVEVLKAAVEKLWAGSTYKAVAAEYGIKLSSFVGYCKDNVKMLSNECEKDLVDHLEYLSNHGFIITHEILKHNLSCLRQRCGTGICLSVKMMSDYFISRHPEIFHQSNLYRTDNKMTTDQLTHHLTLVKSTIDNLDLGKSPERIFNCGSIKLLDLAFRNKNTKEYCKLTRNEKLLGENSTLHVAISASGEMLSNYFIYSETLEWYVGSVINTLPEKWILETSNRGFLGDKLLQKWFEAVFLPMAGCSGEKPVLLIMSNRSHIPSPALVESAERNNVYLLGYPEHYHALAFVFNDIRGHISASGVLQPGQLLPAVANACLTQIDHKNIKRAFRNAAIFEEVKVCTETASCSEVIKSSTEETPTIKMELSENGMNVSSTSGDKICTNTGVFEGDYTECESLPIKHQPNNMQRLVTSTSAAALSASLHFQNSQPCPKANITPLAKLQEPTPAAASQQKTSAVVNKRLPDNKSRILVRILVNPQRNKAVHANQSNIIFSKKETECLTSVITSASSSSSATTPILSNVALNTLARALPIIRTSSRPVTKVYEARPDISSLNTCSVPVTTSCASASSGSIKPMYLVPVPTSSDSLKEMYSVPATASSGSLKAMCSVPVKASSGSLKAMCSLPVTASSGSLKAMCSFPVTTSSGSLKTMYAVPVTASSGSLKAVYSVPATASSRSLKRVNSVPVTASSGSLKAVFSVPLTASSGSLKRVDSVPVTAPSGSVKRVYSVPVTVSSGSLKAVFSVPLTASSGSLKRVDSVPVTASSGSLKRVYSVPVTASSGSLKRVDSVPVTASSGSLKAVFSVPLTASSGSLKRVDSVPVTASSGSLKRVYSVPVTASSGSLKAVYSVPATASSRSLKRVNSVPVTASSGSLKAVFSVPLTASSGSLKRVDSVPVTASSGSLKRVYAVPVTASSGSPKRVNSVPVTASSGSLKRVYSVPVTASSGSPKAMYSVPVPTSSGSLKAMYSVPATASSGSLKAMCSLPVTASSGSLKTMYAVPVTASSGSLKRVYSVPVTASSGSIKTMYAVPLTASSGSLKRVNSVPATASSGSLKRVYSVPLTASSGSLKTMYAVPVTASSDSPRAMYSVPVPTSSGSLKAMYSVPATASSGSLKAMCSLPVTTSSGSLKTMYAVPATASSGSLKTVNSVPVTASSGSPKAMYSVPVPTSSDSLKAMHSVPVPTSSDSQKAVYSVPLTASSGSLKTVYSVPVTASSGSLKAMYSVPVTASSGSLKAMYSVPVTASSGSLKAMYSVPALASSGSLKTMYSVPVTPSSGSQKAVYSVPVPTSSDSLKAMHSVPVPTSSDSLKRVNSVPVPTSSDSLKAMHSVPVPTSSDSQKAVYSVPLTASSGSLKTVYSVPVSTSSGLVKAVNGALNTQSNISEMTLNSVPIVYAAVKKEPPDFKTVSRNVRFARSASEGGLPAMSPVTVHLNKEPQNHPSAKSLDKMPFPVAVYKNTHVTQASSQIGGSTEESNDQ